MDTKTAFEVIAAYDRREKGLNLGRFVDHTRNDVHLEIDRTAGTVRLLTEAEYLASPDTQCEDGVPISEDQADQYSDTDDDSDTCPDCHRDPCISAHGGSCPP
jgi:hypothetical protein